MWDSAVHYFKDSGRPNVLGVAQGELTIWLFDTEFQYHAFLILLTLVAAGVLYALVRELGVSSRGGLLVIVLLAGAIQFRSYHDGLLGYSGTMPIVMALTLGSLLLFLRGLRREDTKLIVWSFLVFLPCSAALRGDVHACGGPRGRGAARAARLGRRARLRAVPRAGSRVRAGLVSRAGRRSQRRPGL